ncbi:sortase B [Mammaliicoccus lentus]|jgi:sortase B|uniref:class B sortase n=1 Tax=Mammaliicoccus lentus TaxID=42858 RepID=UPI0002FC0FCE|nr:class B sortase [Mammaliicoccus lentus]MBF0749572.1 class B sortase [Mammaliicoccus lentus]MCD2477502.1 class B sortase [Mammaliicoccus lentus]MCD2521119.1 class B sortase [Mammaliicoccus lentus]MCR1873626.1 class B sortase [Mammaliicoccus lentus]MEB5685195.1 class B sortase [Mammaliicoccus lentus]
MKIIIRLIQIALIGVIVWSGYTIYNNKVEDKKTEERYVSLQQKYTQVSSNKTVRPQFKQLDAVNPDIIGWIHLDATTLNYPILQSKDNEDYLKKDFENQYSRKGSIFMDYRNSPKHEKMNTVIYGHHVGDDTMFDTVEKYLDQSFYDQHKTMQYDTKYGKYQLEVISAYETTTEDDYIQTDFSSSKQYEKFLEETLKKSEISTTTEINKNDKIVTLSTCEDAYSLSSGRIVVVAKLVEI